MTVNEAFEQLTIICEPFAMYPPIRRIMVQIEARDVQAAYFEVTQALADSRIARAKPIYDRLERWEANVTNRK